MIGRVISGPSRARARARVSSQSGHGSQDPKATTGCTLSPGEIDRGEDGAWPSSRDRASSPSTYLRVKTQEKGVAPLNTSLRAAPLGGSTALRATVDRVLTLSHAKHAVSGSSLLPRACPIGLVRFHFRRRALRAVAVASSAHLIIYNAEFFFSR